MARICDWAEVLEDDERLLWQGRPGIGIVVSTFQYLVMATFLLSVTNIYYFSGGPPEKHALAVNLFYIAYFVSIVLYVLWPSFVRSRSRYAVTNKRALIAMNKPFAQAQITSYPAQNWTPLVLTDKHPSNLYFTSRELFALRAANRHKKVGFEQISDGNDVHKVMQDVQSACNQDRVAQ